MREPTFPIYKKFRFVFWGILLLVNAMPAFSDNCNVPLNNLGSNLDCRQRWDLYNYLHNAQTVLNFERAALSVKMNDTDSIRAFKVAAVDSLFSAVDMLSIIKDAKTADTLVKDIATLNDLGLTAASTYRDVIGDDMDVELQNLLGDISACAYDAIFDSKISALKPFDAVFDTGLCLAPIAFSSWYNLKATFAFDNIAERFNSVTIASTYLLDCYIDDSCSKTPDETANTLGFTNDWWRTILHPVKN